MPRFQLNGLGAADSDGTAKIGTVGRDGMIADVT